MVANPLEFPSGTPASQGRAFFHGTRDARPKMTAPGSKVEAVTAGNKDFGIACKLAQPIPPEATSQRQKMPYDGGEFIVMRRETRPD